MKNILVIDNYDSFTYNLVHILHELGYENNLRIERNDTFELDEVEQFDQILLSPGPGVPSNAGLMPEVIRRFAPSKNILGVCLGHQGIGEIFGSRLRNLDEVYHGIVTKINITQQDELFRGIPSSFEVCRYHSWVIDQEQVGSDLTVTSVAENGVVMSVKDNK
ncbi:MAG: aminodeoxychorismate/anthranilate synthase component II [Bacteroidota bacterium]